jgi:peptide/nickel transport system permease protein
MKVWATRSVLLRRVAQAIPVALGVVLLVFVVFRLTPGDPARALLGPQAPQSAIDALRATWGLDEPLQDQLLVFLGRLARGDLGDSLVYGKPVTSLIADRLAPTLVLVSSATALIVLVTIPLSIVAAIKPNGLADQVVRLAGLIGLGMPTLWVGLVLLVVFAVALRLFPVGGWSGTPLQLARSTVLPAVAIAIVTVPVTIRSLRAALIEVLNADFIATARSKGLSRRRVLLHHALPNAAIPMMAVLAIHVGWLVGNTMLVEVVFAIPGIGSLLFQSIVARDFPLVQGITLVVSVLVVVINALFDIAQSLVDPRLKVS